MAARRLPGRPHIVLKGTSTAEPFTSPVQGGGKLRTIPVDRARHGNELREQLEKARELEEAGHGDEAERLASSSSAGEVAPLPRASKRRTVPTSNSEAPRATT